MLRLLVVALLLANALFLVWSLGWLDAVTGIPARGDRDPERLSRQVDPQRIALLGAAPSVSIAVTEVTAAAPAASMASPAAKSASAAASMAAPTSASASASASAPAPAPAPAPAVSVPASAASAPARAASAPASGAAGASASASAAIAAQCLQAGPFDPAALATAETALREALPDTRWTRKEVPAGGEWMIYMGPYPDDAWVERKKAELARIRGGVPYQVVEASAEPGRGISLGRFDSQAAAEQRLQQYRTRGIRTARVIRSGDGEPGVVLQIAQARPPLMERLAAIRWPAGRGFAACRAAATR